MPVVRTCSPSLVTSTTSPSSTYTNSSSCVCQWRSADWPPDPSVTRLTPNLVSPQASPSRFLIRSPMRDLNGSGYPEPRRSGAALGSTAGSLGMLPLHGLHRLHAGFLGEVRPFIFEPRRRPLRGVGRMLAR